MKTTLTILISFLTIGVYSQTICESDNYIHFWHGDTINRVIDNKKQGPWIYYDQTIKCNDCDECFGGTAIISYKIVSKGQYQNDKRVGNWHFYYDDLSTKRFVKYQDGQLDSIETSYDLSSKVISKTNWKHGEKDSLIVYYDGGIIKYRSYYDRNKLAHFWIYYPNGNLKYEACQISGLKAGKLYYYDENGNKLNPRDNDIIIIASNEDLIKYIE